jgi:hypothetical protein
MNLTYKTDDSFFTLLVVPGDFHRDAVLKWFEKSTQAKFRFIRDTEIESDYLNLQQIDDIYPGIKTVAIVSNPWLRVVRAYNTVQDLKTQTRKIPATVFDFDTDSFKDFVCNIKNTQPTSKYWFTPITPQVSWLKYSTDGTERLTDYILNSETIEQDFKIIQDYFCTDTPLTDTDEIPTYHKYYTKKTREIIADIFAEDIEYFNYKF